MCWAKRVKRVEEKGRASFENRYRSPHDDFFEYFKSATSEMLPLPVRYCRATRFIQDTQTLPYEFYDQQTLDERRP